MSKQAAEKSKLHQQEENPSVWDRTSEQQSGYHKRVALEIIDQLHQNSRLDNADYDALYDGLCEIEPLRDRDDMLEELWAQFGEAPMNPETECIEAPFLGWGPGTNREEIWHWFDCRYSKGIAHLLHGVGNDKAGQFSRMMYLRQLCMECTSSTCQFNHGGECRFAMVHERKPRISDEDGCIDYNYHESEEEEVSNTDLLTQEMRKLFSDDSIMESITFEDNLCSGTLGENFWIIVRFVSNFEPELNDALEIAVLGRLGCTTDKLTLSFEKIWGADPVFLNSKSGWEASSDIWACPNKATRYPYEPTAENWAQLRDAVKRYIQPFRQQALEQNHKAQV